MEKKWLLELLSKLEKKDWFIVVWVVVGILFFLLFNREKKRLNRRNFKE